MDIKTFNNIYYLQKRFLGDNVPEHVTNMKNQLDTIDEQIKSGGDSEQLTLAKQELVRNFAFNVQG